MTHRNFKLLSFSVMAASFSSLPASSNNKFYFTRQQIENSPSRRAGLDPDKELSYRQQAANLLQDMGQRLNVYLFIALCRTKLTLARWLAALSFSWSRFDEERGWYLLLCCFSTAFSSLCDCRQFSAGFVGFSPR